LKLNPWFRARAELQRIVKGNGLEDGAEFVVAVRTFPKDVETQIDFRKRWDPDFAHEMG